MPSPLRPLFEAQRQRVVDGTAVACQRLYQLGAEENGLELTEAAFQNMSLHEH